MVLPTFSLENGTLKGTQVRFDAPAKDGEAAVEGYQAATGNDISKTIDRFFTSRAKDSILPWFNDIS